MGVEEEARLHPTPEDQDTPVHPAPMQDTPMQDTPVQDTPVQLTQMQDAPLCYASRKITGKTSGKRVPPDEIVDNSIRIHSSFIIAYWSA